jgi:serine/threonine protein kinase
MFSNLAYIDQGLSYGTNADGVPFYLKTIHRLEDKYSVRHKLVAPIVDIIQKDESEDSVDIIYPFVEYDLHHFMFSKQSLSERHVQWIMYQLLLAIHGFHALDIEHGSIEPRNITINEGCNITLGVYHDRKPYYTPEWLEQCTVQLLSPVYQSPFLHGKAQDMFSAGCIMAELVQKIDSEKTPDILVKAIYSKEQVEIAVQRIKLPETTEITEPIKELIKSMLNGRPVLECLSHPFFKIHPKQRMTPTPGEFRLL